MRSAWPRKQFAFFMEMGTGKTFTTLALAGHRFNQGQIDAVLVVAPTSIKTVWKWELEKLSPVPTECHINEAGKNKATQLFLETETGALKYLIVGVEEVKREAICKDFNQAQAFIAKVNVFPLKITVTDDVKKRSLTANAVQHCFYKIIADYTGEDIKTIGHRMKRDIGLPILLASDCGEKAAWLLEQLKFYSRTEQQQINMMELIPVTSLFSSKDHTIYRDNLINYWSEQGVILEYK